MKKYATALAGAAVLAVSFAGPVLAKDKIVGVSWSNFQEERWKTDEAAIKKALSRPTATSTFRPMHSPPLRSS